MRACVLHSEDYTRFINSTTQTTRERERHTMSNYFLNLENGVTSISTSRLPQAIVGNMDDLVEQFGDDDSETLSINLTSWIEEECKNIVGLYSGVFTGASEDDIRNAVFGDLDFLSILFEFVLNSNDYLEYPELRANQNDLVRDLFNMGEGIL